MASATKEAVGDSGSAAGPLQAAVGSECPICLGAVRKPAYVAYCMHQFCFSCIRHWARGREDCPVCRQALEQVLHSVRGDDDYELFVVGLPARLRRRMAMDRAGRRRPQRRYDLRRRPAAEPLALPGDTERSPGQGAAPEPSRAQPDPTARTRPEPTRRTGYGGRDHQTRRTGRGGQDHQTRRTGHGGQDHQTLRTGHGGQDHQTRRTGHGEQDHQTRRTGHGEQDHQTRRTGHGGQDHQTRRTTGAPPDPRHGEQ